ncbi:family 16 glycoside hydrolase [Pedobacter sp. PWIIR3]
MKRRVNTRFCLALMMVSLVGMEHSTAQALKSHVALDDLQAFTNVSKNWTIAGNIHADLKQLNNFTLTKGKGILVNQMDKGKPGSDLYFTLQHGDIDLEMDYMMARGTNSGIYLQGRYEVQLFDSWGAEKPNASDNGGIYERWDDSKPEGEKGYEGHAPRQNVSRAPGLWQHIKISFQAPRFDDKGMKTANAKMLYVWLNGILIQENVELSGPTRGAIDNREVAVGPLRLQGDHGAIAFRNISYTNFDKPHPTVSQLKYAVYKGNYAEEPDYKALKPEAQGSPQVLTSNEVKLNNEFVLRYTGSIHIAEPGEYHFKLNVPGGKSSLKVNGIKAVDTKEFKGEGSAVLPAGELPFELFYTKNVDWAKAALGLTVSGPGVREYLLSDANVSTLDAVDKIMINARENTILRSFTDLPGNIRVVHAVGVGSPEQLHYTYDLDNGMIVQLWRGDFLDATPMWHERGDGSSKPAGSVEYFGKPVPSISKLTSADAAWVTDTTSTGFKPKGYKLDKEKRPAFKYLIYGTLVNDASTVLPEGQGIKRTIALETAIPNAFVRLAIGKNIEMIKSGMYCIDDSYYISLPAEGNEKPVVRTQGSTQELIVPIQQNLTYSIIL